jgi:uncharacterized protein YfaP (DUF2135 family)
MKRFHSILMILFMMAIVAVAQKKTANIKFLIGDVQVQPNGQVSWAKAKINDKVSQGDRVKTGISSRAELEMPDGSVIRVDQSSIFDVKDIKTEEDDGEDEMSFSLWAGNIWAKFTKVISGRRSRTVETPSAVVAIRGTTIEMNVDEKQTTKVSVEEGLVSVTSKDVEGEVLVASNQQTIVEQGKPPTDPGQSEGPSDETNSAFQLQLDDVPIQQTDPSVMSSGITISGRTAGGAEVNADGRPLLVNPDGHFRGQVIVKEGFNNIKITAELNGQSVSDNVRVFINTRRPQIRLSSPLVAGFYNRRDYSLSGGVFDETPLDKIKVYINGDEVAEVRGRGTFNRTIILQEGRNDIQVVAEDLAKNNMEIAERLFLDTVKPIITITEPSQPNFTRLEPPPPPDRIGARGERFRQLIRGIIIDPEPSSQLKRITINGKEIQPNSDGSFEAEIALERGENRLQIIAEDMAGNITRDNSRRIVVPR